MRNFKPVLSTRTGAVVPLAAVMMVFLIGVAAFTIDISRAALAKAELQRAADSAALAACWEFAKQRNLGQTPTDSAVFARTTAAQFAGLNPQGGSQLIVDGNSSNASGGDVVFSSLSDFGTTTAALSNQIDATTNAVRVTIHKDQIRNGPLSFVFGQVFGVQHANLSANATAAWVQKIRGFKSPGTETLGILPFSVRTTLWDQLMSGVGADNWSYNPETGTISSGPDGILEINMFPSNNSPGNFGTVDVGNPNNSTSDLRRQIEEGINDWDLAYMGGKIELNSSGILPLNGDTGISASIGSSLETVKGLPRTIFLHQNVTGNGNNATYNVVKFVGIRVMNVKLTGNPKWIMVQPATVITKFVIPSTTDTSQGVISPVVLVR